MTSNILIHGYNLLRHATRDIGISTKRSTHWPTVEKHFLEAHPACECCGTTIRLQIHHIRPFHIERDLELDPTNLITMCMSRNECHLRIAHGDDFKAFCPNIRKYADQANKKEKTLEELYEIAKKSRIYT